VDDDQVLLALGRAGVPLADVVGPERLGILVRRVTDDFGLPAPVAGKDDEWRREGSDGASAGDGSSGAGPG